MSENTIQFNRDDIPEKSLTQITSQRPSRTVSDTTNFYTIVAESQQVKKESLEVDTKETKSFDDVTNEYELMEKFAEGGQGTLFTAQDRFLKRYVVVKSLKDEFKDKPEIISNFLTEARITAQLDHNSIVPLYSINRDQEDGVHMAMKLVNGRTLYQILEDETIDYKVNGIDNHKEHRNLHTRLDFFVKVCDAMSYAHNKGVVHRDLKPDNIMVSEFNEVYVMDWGIAQTFSDGEKDKEKANTLICGTPGFIAPEILQGSDPNAKSDQFSLGIILYELVSFLPALKGDTIKEISEKTVNGQFNHLEHKFHGINIEEDMRAIIAKSLSLAPEERYGSIAEFAADVRNYLEDEETIARPDNLPRKLSRWIINHRLMTGMLILSLLLAFAVLSIVSLIGQKNTIATAAVREQQLMEFQRGLLLRSQSIDRHFLQMENILKIFANESSFFLGHNIKDNSKKFFYNYQDFSKQGNSAPPGTVVSPLYKQNTSIDAGNYALAPGLQLSDAEKDIRALTPLSEMFLKFMAVSSPGTIYNQVELKRYRNQAMNTGFPIRWIYLGLENGLLLNFPGNGTLPDNYDPRKRPWYINSKKSEGVHWSTPYIDAFGQGLVISPSLCIRDKKGDIIGVASLDVTFDFIIKTMMSSANSKNDVIAKYIVDKDKNVVLCSKLSMKQDKNAEKTFAQVELKKFPYPADGLFKEKGNQAEVDSNGRKRLISTALIPTLGWYYVEEVNMGWLIKQ